MYREPVRDSHVAGAAGYLFSEVPQREFSYRWAISEPRVQNFWYFMPYSGVTGQVGHMQLFAPEMHMKLFPIAQKSRSFVFFAQSL